MLSFGGVFLQLLYFSEESLAEWSPLQGMNAGLDPSPAAAISQLIERNYFLSSLPLSVILKLCPVLNKSGWWMMSSASKRGCGGWVHPNWLEDPGTTGEGKA